MLTLSSTFSFSRAQSVHFVDVTRESGITFTHHSSTAKKYIVESISGGVAAFDFNNDNWLDLYFVNSLTVDTARKPQNAESHLYRNNKDGTFTNVTARAGVGYPGWGMGTCVGDFDGDGWLDLYVTCFGPNKLFRNNGDGSFAEVAQEAGVNELRMSTGCAFGNYDNDGDLDLFVANYVGFDLEELPEFGKGTNCQHRGISVQCGPSGLPGAGDVLYRNNGDGTFADVSKVAGVEDPAGYYGLGVVWTDLNDDGYVDLFVANDTRPNFLYKNNGDGTFDELAFLSGSALGENGIEQGSMGIAVGDYDQDGKLDLYVTNFSDQYNALYHTDEGFLSTDMSYQSRTAESSVAYVGWGTEFFDFDNDGWVDLLAVNGHSYPQVDMAKAGIGYAQKKLLYKNNGDGTFSEVSALGGAALLEKRSSRGAAFADLDNDGDVDVVVNDLDGAPMLLRNEGGNRQNWVRIRVEGPPNNRHSIGARVKVVSGDLVQISEIRSGGSYISQSDLRPHFGLKNRTLVDLIEVRWLDGSVRRLKKIAANQEIKVSHR